LPVACAGACFATCRDLTGAAFVRCKFAGSKGKPSAVGDLIVEDCDVNRDGCSSD
jgi:hypothetical protein